MTRSEPAPWLAPAVLLILALTAARIALLVFDRTDLFVDESQYWLWGQHFAFGYYSKPPLIAWVIGTVTALSGSDDPFWVRAPGAVFHGATALILGATAARLIGNRAGFWTAVTYATLPMVTLGSLLISTDTIMAPFFAAALYFHTRLIETPALRHAVLAGAMAGVAFLGKYAAVYFLLGVGLGALLVPALRLRPAHAAALLAAFACVILPNLLWNVQHGMSTASHILDNIGWVRRGAPLSALSTAGLAEFFFAQFAVFGPITFATLIWAAITLQMPRLLVFALPPVLLVCLQALLDRAYANWARGGLFRRNDSRRWPVAQPPAPARAVACRERRPRPRAAHRHAGPAGNLRRRCSALEALPRARGAQPSDHCGGPSGRRCPDRGRAPRCAGRPVLHGPRCGPADLHPAPPGPPAGPLCSDLSAAGGT